jgi:predicted PhzF superfamily epimerase YddE/YHI9
LAPEQPAHFHTRSGLLTARQNGELIELDFPALAQTATAAPPALLAALGLEPRYVGEFGGRYLLQVDSEAIVRNLKPDFHALRALPGRGVVVTSAATTPGHDFVSRYFAPWVGIDEDPVTGSAHCCLGPFWGARLGKDRLTAVQASARGGTVQVWLQGERVILGGHAVTVLRGELLA